MSQRESVSVSFQKGGQVLVDGVDQADLLLQERFDVAATETRMPSVGGVYPAKIRWNRQLLRAGFLCGGCMNLQEHGSVLHSPGATGFSVGRGLG